MTAMTEIARKFFEACETGRGWQLYGAEDLDAYRELAATAEEVLGTAAAIPTASILLSSGQACSRYVAEQFSDRFGADHIEGGRRI